MSTQANESDDLRELLARRHRQLNQVFADLVSAFNSGEQDQAQQLWTRFEHELEAHLVLEETLILSELAKVLPEEAAGIRSEHAMIREKVQQLGVGLDLHLLRADAVAELILELKDHAEREDRLMYRWIGANLRAELQNKIKHESEAALRATDAASPTSGSERGEARLVVYIEDNAANVALMRDVLDEFGNVELVTAPSAELGIEIVRARRPDVVIMDVHLPGMNGIEAAKRLREWPETRDIPVIGLSASARVRDSFGAVANAFHRYLEKPLKIDELMLALEALLASP